MNSCGWNDRREWNLRIVTDTLLSSPIQAAVDRKLLSKIPFTLHHPSPSSLRVGKSFLPCWKEYLLGLEKVSFRVLGSNFSIVATRLGRPAEPSQQVCRLQSAPLSSLVGTPCCPTTITSLVVQL